MSPLRGEGLKAGMAGLSSGVTIPQTEKYQETKMVNPRLLHSTWLILETTKALKIIVADRSK